MESLPQTFDWEYKSVWFEGFIYDSRKHALQLFPSDDDVIEFQKEFKFRHWLERSREFYWT